MGERKTEAKWIVKISTGSIGGRYLQKGHTRRLKIRQRVKRGKFFDRMGEGTIQTEGEKTTKSLRNNANARCINATQKQTLLAKTLLVVWI